MQVTALSYSKILVVIPVYNHGDTLRGVAEKALQTGFEVLVVDDGSTDNGMLTISDIECLTHSLPVNRGKGAAILAGAKIASAKGYDAIITVDADGQHDPAGIPLLAEETQNQWPVIVLGDRCMDEENVPRSSLFGRSFSNFWVRLETGWSLPDTQSGMRLYPVRELLLLSIHTSHYDFEIESLVRGAWAGIPIRSVSIPVHYPPSDERISHFDKFRDNVRLTLLHTQLVARSLFPWPHKKFVLKKKLEWLGHLFFYAMLRIGGQSLAYLFLYPVIFVYVLGSRKIHRNASPYFRKRFPDHGWLRLHLDVFKNVLSFGKVLVDRGWMGFNPAMELSGTFEDSEKLRKIIQAKKGVVVLLAHAGNWQTSLVRLQALDVDVHALMEFDVERVSKHFFELRGETPFHIIDVHGFMGGMIEATTALQKGGLVMMMADRMYKGRAEEVDFLGHKVRFPVAAYHLAATAGSPVVILLSAKTGQQSYTMALWDIFYPGQSGKDKKEELNNCARRFSAALERYVEQYPYQWYNFFDIWKQ